MKFSHNNNSKNYKLSQEDYDNIWLRLKEKSWKLVLGYLASIVLIFSYFTYVGINSYIENRVNNEIKSLVNSDSFKKDVLNSLESKLNISNNQYSQLLDINRKLSDSLLIQINKVKALRNFPIKCNDYGFELVSSDGKSLKLQYGHGITDRPMYFESSFLSMPSVLLTPHNPPVPYSSEYSNKPLVIRTINSKFFLVDRPSRVYFPQNFDWIAIGK